MSNLEEQLRPHGRLQSVKYCRKSWSRERVKKWWETERADMEMLISKSVPSRVILHIKLAKAIFGAKSWCRRSNAKRLDELHALKEAMEGWRVAQRRSCQANEGSRITF